MLSYKPENGMVLLHISDCVSPHTVIGSLPNSRYVAFKHDSCTYWSNRISVKKKKNVTQAAVQANTLERQGACSPCPGTRHSVWGWTMYRLSPWCCFSKNLFTGQICPSLHAILNFCNWFSTPIADISTVIRNSFPVAEQGQFKHQSLSLQSQSERSKKHQLGLHLL